MTGAPFIEFGEPDADGSINDATGTQPLQFVDHTQTDIRIGYYSDTYRRTDDGWRPGHPRDDLHPPQRRTQLRPPPRRRPQLSHLSHEPDVWDPSRRCRLRKLARQPSGDQEVNHDHTSRTHPPATTHLDPW